MTFYQLRSHLRVFRDRWLSLRISLGRFGDVVALPLVETENIWIGLSWKVERDRYRHYDDSRPIVDRVAIWICLIPCLPIRVSWRRFEEDECHF